MSREKLREQRLAKAHRDGKNFGPRYYGQFGLPDLRVPRISELSRAKGASTVRNRKITVAKLNLPEIAE